MLKAMLVGNIGNDPELRYSTQGDPILRFNVASNGRVKNQAGEWVDETTWVRVTVFGKRADTLNQYLRKGLKVYVDGRLEARPWTDSRGEIKAGLEVIANDVEFMSQRGQEDNDPLPGTKRVSPAERARMDADGELPF